MNKMKLKLTSEEMEEFIGGLGDNTTMLTDDIENRNWGSGCYCEYPNKPTAITNVNVSGSCECRCV